MEQLSKQLCIRLSEEEVKLLQSLAKEQNRSMGWIVRENLKKGLAQTD